MPICCVPCSVTRAAAIFALYFICYCLLAAMFGMPVLASRACVCWVTAFCVCCLLKQYSAPCLPEALYSTFLCKSPSSIITLYTRRWDNKMVTAFININSTHTAPVAHLQPILGLHNADAGSFKLAHWHSLQGASRNMQQAGSSLHWPPAHAGGVGEECALHPYTCRHPEAGLETALGAAAVPAVLQECQQPRAPAQHLPACRRQVTRPYL